MITPSERSARITALAALGASTKRGLVTHQVTARQVRSNEQVSKEQRSHEIGRAREDRDQERKADACLLVAKVMGPANAWATWKTLEADPAILKLEPLNEPASPSDDEYKDANAAGGAISVGEGP